MHFVRKAIHVAEWRLLLRFETGEERVVDLRPHLDGDIFEPLKDVEYFRRFRVSPDLDTVTWENGADFSPDFLYEIGLPLDSQSQLSAADR